MAKTLQSLALDRWVEPAGSLADIASAVDGGLVARVSSAGLDFAAMARHAREVGGPALRKMSFHQRADRLRALAAYLGERKESLYHLAGDTGANRRETRSISRAASARCRLTPRAAVAICPTPNSSSRVT
jgi:oxepin-CoA hydrolase/3-oxo-5,6-dehydrosuberyl-CoA semialdehyde dehydrogenase